MLDKVERQERRKNVVEEEKVFPSLCDNTGIILSKNGEYDGFLDLFHKALVIKENRYGKEQISLAPVFDNIGIALRAKGDSNG